MVVPLPMPTMMTTMTTTTIVDKLLSEPFPLVLQSARRRSRAIFMSMQVPPFQRVRVNFSNLAKVQVSVRFR
jgi:hypothetical protein